MRAATKTTKPGSGTRIREIILKGIPNDAVLAIIKKEFKGGNTTTGEVSWNRSLLKTEMFDAPKKVVKNAEALAKGCPSKPAAESVSSTCLRTNVPGLVGQGFSYSVKTAREALGKTL